MVVYRGGWRKACLGTTNPALRTPSHSWGVEGPHTGTEPGADHPEQSLESVGDTWRTQLSLLWSWLWRPAGPSGRYNFVFVFRVLKTFIFVLSSQEASKRQDWGHRWHLQLPRYGMGSLAELRSHVLLTEWELLGQRHPEVGPWTHTHLLTYSIWSMVVKALGPIWSSDMGLCECQGVGRVQYVCVWVCTEQSLWWNALLTLSCSVSSFCCGSQSHWRMSIFGSKVLAVSWCHHSNSDPQTEPLGGCVLWSSGC